MSDISQSFEQAVFTKDVFVNMSLDVLKRLKDRKPKGYLASFSELYCAGRLNIDLHVVRVMASSDNECREYVALIHAPDECFEALHEYASVIFDSDPNRSRSNEASTQMKGPVFVDVVNLVELEERVGFRVRSVVRLKPLDDPQVPAVQSGPLFPTDTPIIEAVNGIEDWELNGLGLEPREQVSGSTNVHEDMGQVIRSGSQVVSDLPNEDRNFNRDLFNVPENPGPLSAFKIDIADDSVRVSLVSDDSGFQLTQFFVNPR